MDNEQQRDHAEEAENRRLIREGDDEPADKDWSERWAFFYEHGGVSRTPSETTELARSRCAAEYADAETWAELRGFTVTWEDDDGDHSYLDSPEHAGTVIDTCELATLRYGGDILASQGCVDNADDTYRRVVAGELALEAYGKFRAQFSDDAWALYEAGQCCYEVFPGIHRCRAGRDAGKTYCPDHEKVIAELAARQMGFAPGNSGAN